jgi:hypothetical protein
VSGATTPTDTLAANPNGTLTLNRSQAPVRKLISGVWKNLDASLKANSDGSISPAITSSALRLSGGGNGPLATMTSAGRSLAISLPLTLPTPRLSGTTATYSDVLSGVDLQVTVNIQGGLSEVLIVHDATAAKNPALKTLTLATRTSGVTLTADGAGNIAANDQAGQGVFTAPAPMMWDSTKPAKAAAAVGIDPATGRPVGSTVNGPGEAARTATVTVAATKSGITLTPNQSLLTAPTTTYPVFIDPTFNPTKSGWASVSEYYPSTNYWNNTPDPQGYMQVGNSGSMWSHTLINFPINVGMLTGATIQSAQLNITETYSFSCSASTVNVYAPSTTLKSNNATWNYWAGVSLGGVVASANVAHGYSSSCPAAGVGFNVLGAINAAVSAKRTTQTFVLTGSSESSDHNSWKEFQTSSPTLSVTYDHAPSTPTGMTTSPVTACTAATPTAVGDGQVSLYAPVSDPDGGSLGVTFELWKTSASGTILKSTDPNLLTYTSGTTAVLVVSKSTFGDVAGGAITEFSWHVRVTDFTYTSAWSATCNFNFDPTRPDQPIVSSPATSTIWQPTTLTVTKPTTGVTPTAYMYQLNGGPPGTVIATAGNATITVVPNRFTNTVTVTALSAGGNLGNDSASTTFNASSAATAADADMTGDDVADLLTVGGANSIPAGLWLAPGNNTGAVATAATDIGSHGNAIDGDQLPADFTGAQAITGHFFGTGVQDVLVYYPTGANAGGGVILKNNGDGSPIQAQLDSNQHAINAGARSDINGDNPLQLANAGNASGQNLIYPDLIAINGDAASGYYLDYYPNQNGLDNYQFPAQLATATPTGATDWNNWTITTTVLSTGTAMFLWNATTGGLYLWQNLSYDLGSGTLAYTQYTLSTNWNNGNTLSLRAGDLNQDGIPDLWAVGAGLAVTGYLVAGLTTTPTVTAQPTQALLAPSHAWQLNDANDGPATIATDTVGTLNATALTNGTGATGATWHTGDLFSPDVALNGTIGGLATSGPALAHTNTDFAVSVWAKPTATGGVVLSQDGTHAAGFKLWPEASDSSWRFALSTSDTTSPTYDTAAAAAGSVKLGVWTHLTATYKQSTGAISLYVNGSIVATATHTTTWDATGNFQIGDYLSAGSHTGYFTGQVADVQTYGQAITLPTTGGTTTSTATTGGQALVHDGFTSLFTVDSSNGHLQETYLTRFGAAWVTQDLSANYGTPAVAGTPVAVVHGGYTSVYTIDAADGHLQETYLTSLGAPWVSHDLSASTGTPASAAIAPAVVVHGGYTSVYTVNSANGHLQETYLPAGATTWSTQDLSAVYGTPAVKGSPTALLHDGFVSVYTVNSTNSHLQETYLPGIGQSWSTQDLTTVYGTPAAAGSPAVQQHDGFVSVYTVNSTNSHLQETYLPGIGQSWSTQDLTTVYGTPAAAGSPAVQQHDGFVSVFTINAGNNHLQETYLSAIGQPWASHDLTAGVGSPMAAAVTAATVYHDGVTSVYTVDAGTGNVRETLLPAPSPWTTQNLTTNFGTPPTHLSKRLAFMVGGSLSIKDGELDGPVTSGIATNVAKFGLDGSRLAYLDTSGNFYAKDTLAASWGSPQATGVSDFQLAAGRIAVLFTTNTLEVKQALTDSWTVETNPDVTAFQIDGTRIGVLTAGGTFYVKDGPLGAAWVTAATSGVASFKISGNRIGYLDPSGGLHIQTGAVTNGWSADIAGAGTQDFELDGTRIGVLTANNTVYVKDGPVNAYWAKETDNDIRAFQLSGTRIAVLTTASELIVKDGDLNAGWVHETSAGTVSTFQLHGTRIAALDATGTLRGQDGGLTATWYAQTTGPATSYQLTTWTTGN